MQFSCIIPAYNEWPRIAKVLQTILLCRELDEVIVVNDGSTDNTWEIINSLTHPKLRKINLEKNSGKANAVLHGVQVSKWDFIVMIDSDLLGLTKEHIYSLLFPIQNNIADVTISIRKNSLPLYKFFWTDFVSGERVLPRGIFDNSTYYTSGPWFGLEVKMNKEIIQHRYRIQNIYLSWVITPRKSLKYWFIKWTLADWRMLRDILSIFSIRELLYQFWYFSRFSWKK